jgi:tetratricopeptide (TPR) repeat protein
MHMRMAMKYALVTMLGESRGRRAVHPATLTAVTMACLIAAITGCSWITRSGPVPQAVANCRQLQRQGIDAMQRDDWPQAQELLTRAVDANPQDPEARRLLAEVLWRRGTLDAAAAQLETARKSAPDNGELTIRAGELYLAMHQFQRALHRADEALDYDPALARAWLLRGQVCRSLGRNDEALAAYLRAIGRIPDDRATMIELTELYLETSRPQRALAVVHGLCDTYRPGEQPREAMDLKGQALAQLGRHNEAADSYVAALRAGPPTADLVCRLGEVLWQAGRTEAAQHCTAQALAMEPGHARSQLLDQRLRIAQARPGERAPR